MHQNEEGAVLVISIIIILTLVLLSTALVGSINNNISFVKRHENDIKSFYAAEAGIEKAINKIKIDTNEVDNQLDSNQEYTFSSDNDNEWDNIGEYSFSIEDASSSDNDYQITSTGIHNNVDKEISVLISRGGDETIISGEEIDLESGKSETIVDSYRENADDIPILDDLSINIEDIKNEALNERDPWLEPDITNDIVVTDKNPKPKKNEYVFQAGDKIYSSGDITFTANGNNTRLGPDIDDDDYETKEPIVIWSEGNVTVDEGLRELNKVIIITKGKIIYNMPNAQVDFNNVFIYSAYKGDPGDDSIEVEYGADFSKDKNNPNLNPNLNFKGQIIARDDVRFFSKEGIVEYAEVDLPDEFKELENQLNDIKQFVINSWQEN